MSGHVYKRCSCPVHRDAKGKKLPCPRTHGSWTFVANATVEGPQPRRQHTKGGFGTKREAEAALRAFQASVDRGEVQRQSKITVKDYLVADESWVCPLSAPWARQAGAVMAVSMNAHRAPTVSRPVPHISVRLAVTNCRHTGRYRG